jgi:spermidine/putrescine-binding protein
MKKVMLCIILLLAGCFTVWPWPVLAATETINITCWEGYANKAVIDAFKSIVKNKYKMDVEVKATYATGQEDFYNAARNGTADLISPPADTPKPLVSTALAKITCCCYHLT